VPATRSSSSTASESLIAGVVRLSGLKVVEESVEIDSIPIAGSFDGLGVLIQL